ncbi:flavodoxin family protein [Anaeroselena agilis]|uniref:Flavodoxin family protein n=1 Tax=Anaeroselena agilis TaxID=3063788 RepID=A0ABU3P2G3_9FIRM|nr:flavodoxin family protein [Selenomonadales bacterium 4137-cl]
MKVIGINTSPRKDGNTALLIKTVFGELEKHGIETELLQVGGRPVRGCMACGACRENRDRRCVIADDFVNDCIAKMIAADGIILGSPTYFADVNAEMKALIDRSGYVARGNDYLFKHKAGAAVTAVRRGGATHTFDTINHFFHLNQMILVGATYWNMVYGREIGDVANDEEGMANMRSIGENMAWLLNRIGR